jgi:hypothetical protein
MALATRPKPKTHARKRHAGHHRHNKQYLRSYWPYLPMLLIVGLGLLVNSTWSGSSVLGSKSDFSTAALLTTTNAERLKQNEPALTLNAQLSAAAQAKAEDMVRNNYWAHSSPDGKTPWSFIDAAGYQYQSAGENLAYGFSSATDSVAAWMDSSEHRANILDAAYQNVGFGIANSPNFMGEGPETVVVAEYGQPAAQLATVPAGAPTVNNPAATHPASNVLGAETEAQPVSRIQILTGDNSQWALVTVIALSGGAMALFLLRHGYRVHRLLSRGEAFVVHHPYLDIAIIFTITAGCVLTRASGIIR